MTPSNFLPLSLVKSTQCGALSFGTTWELRGAGIVFQGALAY
jgi:hypothetical protein